MQAGWIKEVGRNDDAPTLQVGLGCWRVFLGVVESRDFGIGRSGYFSTSFLFLIAHIVPSSKARSP